MNEAVNEPVNEPVREPVTETQTHSNTAVLNYNMALKIEHMARTHARTHTHAYKRFETHLNEAISVSKLK